MVFAQVALLAHDLAHRQVFRSRRASEIAGRWSGNLGIGMSYGWWMDKHTRHHANPNHEDHDPDVAPDVLVWSAEAGRGQPRACPRFIGRWQAFLFFPLLTLEGFNLHVSSVRALRRPHAEAPAHRGGALLIVHDLASTWAPCFAGAAAGQGAASSSPSTRRCSASTWAAPSPPTTRACRCSPARTGRTSCAARCSPPATCAAAGSIDIALGGLNYQIEHHLFPSMPTPNLRKAQPIVREYCASWASSTSRPG